MRIARLRDRDDPRPRALGTGQFATRRARLRRLFLELREEPLRLGDALDLDRDRLDRLLDALQLLGHPRLERGRRAAPLEPAAEGARDRPADDDHGAGHEESDRDVDRLAGDLRTLEGWLRRVDERGTAALALDHPQRSLRLPQRLLCARHRLIGRAALVVGPRLAQLLLCITDLLLRITHALLGIAHLLLCF